MSSSKAPPHRLPPIGSAPKASAWRTKLRARMRPPRLLQITASGRTYLIVTLGVGLGALNTGNNLLYLVLGLLLSLIVVSGVLSERCLRHLRVRRIGAEAAFAGEPFAFRWAVSRRSGHAFALELSEHGEALEGVGVVAHLGPGEEVVVRGDLVAQKRGPYLLSGIRVTTRYPFGLFAKTRVFDAPGALVVYPRRIKPRPPSELHAEGQDGVSDGALKAGGAGDVLGLSPLREGEDARRVHWARSAALGQLVRLERERDERRTYLLRSTVSRPSPQLERECEELAATARYLLSHGHEVGLQTEEAQLRPASGAPAEKRILRALALRGYAEEPGA